MTQTVQVEIENKPSSYTIHIGSHLLENVGTLVSLSKYSQVLILTDKPTAQHWLAQLKTGLGQVKHTTVHIEPGEPAKNIDTVKQIWQQLLELKFDRQSLIINLGGGVIGDIGGFIAGTYMRGIDFVQIPTTLLAQVDASIGGKTGIGFGGIKNSIGLFQQPQAVVIDVETLASLPPRQLNSGFAEIIKHGLITDVDYLKQVTAKSPADFNQTELTKIITKSCQIKADIVANDEKEKGASPRKLLNFGHTIGHAFEAISLAQADKPLLHGEAIAIGMVAEAELSRLVGNITEKDVAAVSKVLQQAGLPITYPKIDFEEIIKKIKNDKKNDRGVTKWTLLENIGQAIVDQVVDEKLVYQALEIVSG